MVERPNQQRYIVPQTLESVCVSRGSACFIEMSDYVPLIQK